MSPRHSRVFHTSLVPSLCLVSTLLFAGLASAQQSGVIVGQATQTESDLPLVGAEVRVRGTAIAALTGQDGRFSILRVPAGDQTIVLSALGRESISRDVTVHPGETIRIDFAVAVSPVTLEGIEVLGFRALAQAEALNRQQNAPNVVNVVAADQIGRFPDASAPEALQRIPGIAVERDQGEGRYIQIRGGRTEFTKVNMNGAPVPSPEGDDRQVALDAVPVDILGSIEVTKAITPDMDADAIGGAVNLVTKKAPQTSTLSLELAGGFAPIRDEPSGKATGTFGRRFDDGRAGLLVLGSFSNRQFGSDDIEPEYDLGGPGLADDVLVEFQTRHYTLERQRTGATAAFDYRFSETSEIQVTGSFTEHKDTEQRRVLNQVVEDQEMAFEHKNREENLRILTGTVGGDHGLGGGIRLNYDVTASRSEEDTPFDNEIFFLQEGVSFSPDLSDTDRIQPNPAAGSIEGPYLFDGIDNANSLTTNTDLLGRADLSIPFGLGEGGTGTLKFGMQVKDKEKDQEIFESALEFNDGTDLFLDGYGEPFDIEGFNPGAYRLPPSSTTADRVNGFSNEFSGRLDSEVDLEANTEDYLLNERILAGYVMTELNITPDLLLLPGVRWERTDFDTDAFAFDPDTEELTPTAAERDYDNLFPMAHLRYRITPRTNVRAAYTTAISRPNFIDLVPFRIRDDNDLELGNPDLDPTTSQNVDLMIEHFSQRVGVLSAGVFAKWLDDPIFVFVSGNELGGDTEQPGNGASGWIRGVELAVQQQLRFLPGALQGLGFYGNYTYTDSEGELPGGRKAQLLGQAEHNFNLALSYERSGFSGQLSLNYVDEYVDEYGGEALEDIYVGARHQLDLSASYQATASSTVFVELLNLTNQPFTLHEGVDARPRQIEFYEPWGQLGVRIRR